MEDIPYISVKIGELLTLMVVGIIGDILQKRQNINVDIDIADDISKWIYRSGPIKYD